MAPSAVAKNRSIELGGQDVSSIITRIFRPIFSEMDSRERSRAERIELPRAELALS
jgi:hypothetical protein